MSSPSSRQDSKSPLVNHLLNITCLLIILYAMQVNATYINQVLLSVVFAILLNPLVKFLNRLYIPFFISLMIIIGGLTIVLSLIGAVIGSTVNSFINNITVITNTALEKFVTLNEYIKPLLHQVGFDYDLTQWASKLDSSRVLSIVNPILSSITSIFSSGFFIFLTTIFILIDTDLLKSKFSKISEGNAEHLNSAAEIFAGVGKYIEKKFIISIFTALAAYLVCNIFGVQFGLMWGVLTLFFNFIPNIGVFMVAVPMILQALLLNSLYPAIGFSCTLIIIHFASGNIIEPRIMSRYLNLGTAVVWLGLIFWNVILGPIGMLLSVPLTTTAKILFEKSRNYKGLAVLMEGECPDDCKYCKDMTLIELATNARKKSLSEEENSKDCSDSQQS